MKFFPFVFTLFMFMLFANVIGLIPYSFTVTSQIIITATFGLLVFFIVVIYGFWSNGLHFFNLFVPKGVPVYILPAIVVIEILSFRVAPDFPQRAFVRQHARRTHHPSGLCRLHHHARECRCNRLARCDAASHRWSSCSPRSSFLVAFLQAYVFAILTCIYLNDAIHPGH